jgi:hypothetical protein
VDYGAEGLMHPGDETRGLAKNGSAPPSTVADGRRVPFDEERLGSQVVCHCQSDSYGPGGSHESM